MSSYFKALAVDVDNFVAYNDIGVVYETMGLTENAEQNYLAAITVNDRYLPPYSNLGYLYKRQQNFSKAIEYFQKRIDLAAPNDPWVAKIQDELNDIYDQSPYLKQKAMDGETRRLNREIEQKNLRRNILAADKNYFKGMRLYRGGKYLEAYQAFAAALKLTPGNPKIVRARNEALLEYKREQIDQRLDAAKQAIVTGQNDSAEQQLRDILTVVPNVPGPEPKKTDDDFERHKWSF